MIEQTPGIADEGSRQRLNRYLDCLGRWASRMNLTGADTRAGAYQTLIAPILGAEALLMPPVIDVGSGNGSPGLILAALRPDMAITLLEPRARRWAFLREAAREMGVAKVTVLRQRSEQYQGPGAHTVTMRAVGLSPGSLKDLLLPGGCVLVFGGPAIAGSEAIVLPSGSTVQRQCFT